MFNQRDRLKGNIDAIRTVLENTSGRYSAKEIEIIRGYCGFGAIKAILYANDTDWDSASMIDSKLRPGIEALHMILQDGLTGREYKAIIESMKSGILTQYFTPAVIPRTFYNILKQYTEVTSLYEPSAGMGVFITEADKVFKMSISLIQVYEKDILTARLLKAVSEYSAFCQNKPFEESDKWEDGQFDLICSNIPFGSYPVFDPLCTDKNYYGKVHNYFFWKGLTKIKNGGLLAFLVSSAFLDTITNKSIREYLFTHSDFISLSILPDNLMKESSNTEAPSHFLVVRKNSNKTVLSEEEQLLIESTRMENGIAMNRYIQVHEDDIIVATGKSIGKDQYGKIAREVHWSGSIEGIADRFSFILQRDFQQRYTLPAIEIPVGKVEITGPDTFKWKEEEEEPTLIEAFQKIGKIMGASLESVSNTKPPWLEDEPNATEQLGEQVSYLEPEDNGEFVNLTREQLTNDWSIEIEETEEQEPEDPLKHLKPKEREIMSAYLCIKEAYIQMTKEEQ